MPTGAPTQAIASGGSCLSSCVTERSSTKKECRPYPMRILWLKSDLLLPLDKCRKLRTSHLMRHLAERHDITYMAFAEPGQPATDVEGMHEVASRVVTITRADASKGSLRFYRD